MKTDLVSSRSQRHGEKETEGGCSRLKECNITTKRNACLSASWLEVTSCKNPF